MFYKQAIYSFLCTVFGIVLLFFITIILSDPYMLFHKKWFYKDYIYKNMRVQSYGLINFKEFDGIILGTSMLENTSASEASQKLKGHFINLSINGGRYLEESVILNYAIKKKKLKRIIMSMDFYGLDKLYLADNTFPKELYLNDSFKEKFMFYFQSEPLKCVFLHKCDFKKYNPKYPNAWKDKKKNKRRFGGFDNWLKYRKEDKQIKAALKQLKSSDFYENIDLDMSKRVVDELFTPLFENQKISFDLIIPPYSILWWKKLASREKVFAVYSYLIQKAENYPNVKVYWFYDEDFPLKIDLYKDLAHYHPSINSLQLNAIKNGTNVIDLKNHKQKFEDWENKIDKFNIQPYLDKI